MTRWVRRATGAAMAATKRCIAERPHRCASSSPLVELVDRTVPQDPPEAHRELAHDDEAR
jgi:hypothetical protein